MAFQKGNKLATGRPIGALNRSTEQMKLTLARAANNTLNNIAEDLEKIRKRDPERAIELSLKMIDYVIPKLGRTDIKAEIVQRIQAININITQKVVDADNS
jgi:hypothetical protein